MHLEEAVWVYNFTVEDNHTYFVGDSGGWVHNARCDIPKTGNKPQNYSPKGAKRRGAFREAKRKNNIPVSEQPKVEPNRDRRGKVQPGRRYEFKNKKTIRDDSKGHIFPDNPTQNRGPHFNDDKGRHFDY